MSFPLLIIILYLINGVCSAPCLYTLTPSHYGPGGLALQGTFPSLQACLDDCSTRGTGCGSASWRPSDKWCFIKGQSSGDPTPDATRDYYKKQDPNCNHAEGVIPGGPPCLYSLHPSHYGPGGLALQGTFPSLQHCLDHCSLQGSGCSSCSWRESDNWGFIKGQSTGTPAADPTRDYYKKVPATCASETSQVDAPCSYASFPSKSLSGSALSTTTEADQAGCLSVCSQTSACKSVVWTETANQCEQKTASAGETGNLQSSAADDYFEKVQNGCTSSSESAVINTTIQVTSKYSLYDNGGTVLSSTGHVISESTGVVSAIGCACLCLTHSRTAPPSSQCLGYTYSPVTLSCTLLDTNAQVAHNTVGTVSPAAGQTHYYTNT